MRGCPCGSLKSRLSGLWWARPAATGGTDKTLLCQEVEQVGRTGGPREFKGWDGLGGVRGARVRLCPDPLRMQTHTNTVTHPGGGAKDGGQGAALHQLTEPGGGVKGADPHQTCGGHHCWVRVLLFDLLSAPAAGTLQQTGGAVEPSTQPHGLWVLLGDGLGFSVWGGCRMSAQNQQTCWEAVSDAQRVLSGPYLEGRSGGVWRTLVTVCGR